MNGELNTNSIFVSGTGNIKFAKYIFNAVCPEWKGGCDDEKLKLKSLCTEIFKLAENMNMTSISLPLLGSGIFNIPSDVSSRIIVESALSFFKTKPIHLKDIILIDMDHQKVKMFIKDVQVYFSEWTIENGEEDMDIQPLLSLLLKDQWFWFDDDQQWKAYKKKYNDIINRAFHIQKMRKFDMEIDGKHYTFDFDNQIQINKNSNYKRKIGRNVKIMKAQWQWMDDEKQWSSYNIKDSDEIEKAYQEKKQTIELTLKRHADDKPQSYCIDLMRNKQINLSTRYKRDIRRLQVERPVPIIMEDEEEENLIEETKYQIKVSGLYRDKVQEAVKKIKEMINNLIVYRTISNCTLTKKEILNLEKEFRIQIENDSSNQFKISGLEVNIVKAYAKLLEDGKLNRKYPNEWEPMNGRFELKLLKENGSEWKMIEDRMKQTIPNVQIVKIERVQNKTLWDKYILELESIKQRVKKDIEYERFLFHGTRKTPPDEIYNGQFGFDMRYSNSGM